MRAKRRPMVTLIRVTGITVLVILLFAAAVIGALTIFEYRPADKESLDITGSSLKCPSPGDTITVEIWNVGYLALGASADFFMDGGHSVMAQTKSQVEENLSAARDEVSGGADIVLLQEVDKDATRSYHIDEVEEFESVRPDSSFVFATNFNVPFVPYPMPPIGKVYGGLLTISDFEITSADRIKLPNPFSWPVRIANLKRCLLISRIPISDSDHELVVINLHLEAYDDGEGKIEQTNMLKEILDKERAAGNYVIAGGDFNQVFSNTDSSAYPSYEGKWQPGEIDVNIFDGYEALQDPSTPTCRSLDRVYDPSDDSFQYYMIDGYVVSDNLTDIHMETRDLGFEHSDHNPVILTVTIPGDR